MKMIIKMSMLMSIGKRLIKVWFLLRFKLGMRYLGIWRNFAISYEFCYFYLFFFNESLCRYHKFLEISCYLNIDINYEDLQYPDNIYQCIEIRFLQTPKPKAKRWRESLHKPSNWSSSHLGRSRNYRLLDSKCSNPSWYNWRYRHNSWGTLSIVWRKNY